MGRRAGVTAEETRAALLEAAITVLLSRGYEGARVSEIAREAGLTTGAMYSHFPSKADLMSAAIEAHAPLAIRRLLAADGEVSVIDAVRELGTSLPDELVRTAPLLLELVVASGRDPEVAGIVTRGLSEREATIAEIAGLAQRNGELDAALDVDALARFVLVLGVGALVLAVVDLDPVDPAAWRTVLDRMLDAARPGALES
jgi:AcrR family transcriptional regulator